MLATRRFLNIQARLVALSIADGVNSRPPALLAVETERSVITEVVADKRLGSRHLPPRDGVNLSGRPSASGKVGKVRSGTCHRPRPTCSQQDFGGCASHHRSTQALLGEAPCAKF